MNAIEEMGVLPDFRWILVHDCWQSYFKLDCKHALCNAHLLPELIFYKEQGTQKWAEKMENILRKACHNPSGFKFDEWKKQYDKIVNDGYSENPYQPPPRAKGQRGRIAKPAVLNLLDRFKQHSPSILRFIQNHIVPFTNNLAERDIRMVKVQKKTSGTFRSWSGARMFARNRSYISTAIK